MAVKAYTDAFKLIQELVTDEALKMGCFELFGQTLSVVYQSTPDLASPCVHLDPVAGDNMVDQNQNTVKTMSYNLHFHLPYYNENGMEKTHKFLNLFEDVLQAHQGRRRDSGAYVKVSTFGIDERDPQVDAIDIHYRVYLGLLFLQ